jgi:hypothetical protein
VTFVDLYRSIVVAFGIEDGEEIAHVGVPCGAAGANEQLE